MKFSVRVIFVLIGATLLLTSNVALAEGETADVVVTDNGETEVAAPACDNPDSDGSCSNLDVKELPPKEDVSEDDATVESVSTEEGGTSEKLERSEKEETTMEPEEPEEPEAVKELEEGKEPEKGNEPEKEKEPEKEAEPEEKNESEDPKCPSRPHIIRCAAAHLDKNKNDKLERKELQSAIDELPWLSRGVLKILGSVDKIMQKCDADGDDAIGMYDDMENTKDRCLASCFKRKAFKNAFFSDCDL